LLVITSAGLYVSSLSTSAVRAMAAGVPAAMGMLLFAQGISVAAEGLGAAAANLGERTVIGSGAAMMLMAMLLALGFLNHASLERSPARIARQVAALLAIVAAGAVVS
jgi:hypothetical protein